MRLRGPESRNVEDRRGAGGGGFRGGGGGLKIGGGIGGVIVLLIGLFFGVDLSGFLDGGGGGQVGYQQPPAQERRFDQGAAPPAAGGQDDAGRRFVAQVLGETEAVWREQFARAGRTYPEPRLVLYTGSTRSGCGFAQAQVGPFYCPADSTVYIDLDFMARLQARLGARGDFASAYIIAHEVGHHVQNVLGVLRRSEAARARYGEGSVEGNQVQVRIELQADCLAGLWANNAQRARRILEEGDVEEGLAAAAAVGDDNVQRSQGRGYVQPETFTHGSSAQRVRWFRRGLQYGTLEACDTFSAERV